MAASTQPNTTPTNTTTQPNTTTADASVSQTETPPVTEASPAVDAIVVSVAPGTDGQDLMSAPSPFVSSLLIRASQTGAGGFVSDRRLFLTPAGTIAEAGDADARYVLVGPGGDLPQDLAAELGLTA